MADLPSVNAAETEACTKIAQGNADCPVFMLNLNKYSAEAQFPDGQLYNDYVSALEALLMQVGGKMLWRSTSRASHGHLTLFS